MSRILLHPYLSPASARKSFEILLSDQESGNLRMLLREEVIFIITHADLQFDWDSKSIIITNIDELKSAYTEEYENNFDHYLKASNALISDTAKKTKIDLSQMDEIKIYPALRGGRKDLKEEYSAPSPQRFFGKMTTDVVPLLRIQDVIKMLLIDSVMQKIFEQGRIDPARYNILQSKISESEDLGAYLRDYAITLKNKLFYPRISDDSMSSSAIGARKYSIESAMADISAAGFEKGEVTPFVTEGGNIITCKDKDGGDSMLIAISDTLFDKHDQFIGASFREENGTEHRYQNYEEFCNRVQAWGESLGYQTIIIHRNLNQAEWKADYGKSNVRALYHADTFIGVAENVLLMPEEKVITEETHRKLIEIFGEENIILMNKNDRENLAANFILVGNHIIFSNPDLSEDVIKQFCDRGFNCVTPPFQLSLDHYKYDGIRCRTQQLPPTSVEQKSQNQLAQPVEAGKEI